MIWWVLLLALNVGLLACVLRLRRHPRARLLLGRFVLLCGGLLIASTFVGVGIGLHAGTNSVGGEAIDPSQKARILAETISEAMNCTAFAVFAIVPSAVAG